MRNHTRPILFILCLVPFALLISYGLTGRLGANPIKEITHFTGDWTLNFLLITLAVTPLRRLTGKSEIVRYRRMLGLFAFFYACLHFLTYLVLDQFFDWQEITADIIKRPYITVGFTAFVLLISLAITSTRKMKLRLGKRWKSLHRLIYCIATLGILHYLWLVKADVRTPVTYGVILILLLLLRLPYLKRRNRKFALFAGDGIQP
ncbi:MAG: sulfite oxidase heme-binding subunit YedZ [Gammaproteobacteria bacterium]